MRKQSKIKQSMALLMICLSLTGCERSNEGLMTAHDVYKNFLEVGAFPPPIDSKLKAILDGSDQFGMTQYQELDLAIVKHCNGSEYSWRDWVNLLPMRVIAIVVPGWNSLRVLGSPEAAIIRQVDAANSCEFNSLLDYQSDSDATYQDSDA